MIPVNIITRTHTTLSSLSLYLCCIESTSINIQNIIARTNIATARRMNKIISPNNAPAIVISISISL